MKKGTKWTLWILGLMLAAIFINFYMNLYSFAYALITVLLLAFMGWGFLAKLKTTFVSMKIITEESIKLRSMTSIDTRGSNH